MSTVVAFAPDVERVLASKSLREPDALAGYLAVVRHAGRDEAEFTAFDDKFHKDRKIAAIYGLLDDIVEAEKSDFKIFDRRL